MKAIIFAGGNQPDIAILKSYVNDFDIVIAADSGLDTVDKIGIYPDYITGDMDSLADKSLLKKYPKSEITKFPCEKDFTDTDAAIAIAEKNEASEIVFVGGGGGRLDHLLYFFKSFGNTDTASIWIHDTGIAFCIDSKKVNCFKLPDIKKAYISVYAVGDSPHTINSKGLFWRIDGLKWDSGDFSLSNKQVTDIYGKPEQIELYPINGRFIILLSPLEIYQYEIEKKNYKKNHL